MKFRKKDFAIAFIIFLVIFSASILDIEGVSILLPLSKSILAALITSLVIGTITNLIFRKKNTQE